MPSSSTAMPWGSIESEVAGAGPSPTYYAPPAITEITPPASIA